MRLNILAPSLEREWSKELLKILNNLNEHKYKEFVFHLRQEITIPEDKSLDRVDLVEKMVKLWDRPTSHCIRKTLDLLKDIQRND